MVNWHRNPDATLCSSNLRNDTANVTLDTRIWSGWTLDQAQAGTYVGVQGDYTQPKVTTSCANTLMSDWVGLGGVTSGSLIQDGTYSPSHDLASPSAWYEYIGPNHSNNAISMPSVTVHEGDHIHNLVLIQKSTGQTTFYVQDGTTGTSQSVIVNLNTSIYYDGTSAEWVDERPTNAITGNYYTLPDFGVVHWTNAKAYNLHGDWLDFGNHSPVLLKMTSDGTSKGTWLAQPNLPPIDNVTYDDQQYNACY